MIRNLTTKSQEDKDIFRQLAHTDTAKYLNKIQKQNKTKKQPKYTRRKFSTSGATIERQERRERINKKI